MKFSVFTVCMPEFDLEETLVKLNEMGFDGVEWRVNTIPTPAEPSFWGYNRSTVDVNTIFETAEAIKLMCEKQKIEIASLGTYINSSASLNEIERLMRAAKSMGVKQMRISPENYTGEENYNIVFDRCLRQYKEIEKLSKKHGVKAIIEMHMGNITPSASAAYRLVSNFDSDCIGVIYDTGNMFYEGFENYKFGLELLGDYLAHVHIKNTKWLVSSKEGDITKYAPTWATFKDGCVDFTAFFEALLSVDYKGFVSFEDFSTEKPTLEKLTEDIEYIKSIVASVKNKSK